MNRVSRVLGHLVSESNAQISSADCAFMDSVEEAPMDAILGMNLLFNKDTDPRKVNVGIGAYRTDEGKPFVLSCVKKAEAKVIADTTLNKEYLPQRGDAEFGELALKMLLGSTSLLWKAVALPFRLCRAQALCALGVSLFADTFLAERSI